MEKLKSLKAQFLMLIAILEELPEQGMPESTVYLALNSNYELSASAIRVLLNNKAITVSKHWITRGPNWALAITNGKKTVSLIDEKLNQGGTNEAR